MLEKLERKPFKFDLNEDAYLTEIEDYLISTYAQHYAKAGTQTVHEIINKGDGIGFCKGNIRKYLDRYGLKGNEEEARKDILKAIHYGVLWLIAHDKESKA